MSGLDILDSKVDVYALADAAEVIVQGYAFFDRGEKTYSNDDGRLVF